MDINIWHPMKVQCIDILFQSLPVMSDILGNYLSSEKLSVTLLLLVAAEAAWLLTTNNKMMTALVNPFRANLGPDTVLQLHINDLTILQKFLFFLLTFFPSIIKYYIRFVKSMRKKI